MATELRKVGAEVEEGEDYIVVTPPQQLTHATIDTYDDHRMAMCFSLVAFKESLNLCLIHKKKLPMAWLAS